MAVCTLQSGGLGKWPPSAVWARCINDPFSQPISPFRDEALAEGGGVMAG